MTTLGDLIRLTRKHIKTKKALFSLFDNEKKDRIEKEKEILKKLEDES